MANRSTADELLTIENLSVAAGVFRLENMTLHLPRGEVLVVLGASGSGKSVFLESVAGFNQPSTGRILLEGREITSYPPEMRQMGVMFQDYALFPHLSVQDNILFSQRFHPRQRRGFCLPWLSKRQTGGAEPQGLSCGAASVLTERVEVGKSQANRCRELDDPEAFSFTGIVETLRIKHLLKRYPGQLSGGEKQRIALARVLFQQPKLFLFDEPMAALDARTREELRGELGRVFKKLGLTAIYVTHDQAEAWALADQVCVLQNGRVVQTGKMEEVFHRPLDVVTARFMGMENILTGTVCQVQRVVGKSASSQRSNGQGQTGNSAETASAWVPKAGLRWEVDVPGLGHFFAYSPLQSELRTETGQVSLGIRSEDIVIERFKHDEACSVGDESGYPANHIRTVIEEISPWGGILYKLQFAGTIRLTALVLKQQLQDLRLDKGAEVRLCFPPDSLHVMPLFHKTNTPILRHSGNPT